MNSTNSLIPESRTEDDHVFGFDTQAIHAGQRPDPATGAGAVPVYQTSSYVAVAIGAKVVWLQLGVVNDEAIRVAAAAGLETVQNRCVKIEHARFFGGLNSVGMNTGGITSRRTIGA